MNYKDFEDMVKLNNKKRLGILSSKGHDYATDERLSNFKRLSKMATLLNVDVQKPEGACIFFILIKLDRLCNLLHKNATPKNESLNDTISDFQNYLELLRGILIEKLSGDK